MRANISFSVEVEDLPTELSRLADHQGHEVLSKCLSIIDCLNGGNFTKAREVILETRQALGNADIRLHEMDQILAGYINILNEQTPEEVTPEEE